MKWLLKYRNFWQITKSSAKKLCHPSWSFVSIVLFLQFINILYSKYTRMNVPIFPRRNQLENLPPTYLNGRCFIYLQFSKHFCHTPPHFAANPHLYVILFTDEAPRPAGIVVMSNGKNHKNFMHSKANLGSEKFRLQIRFSAWIELNSGWHKLSFTFVFLVYVCLCEKYREKRVCGVDCLNAI